ncbi:MAG: hypothetical protein Q8O40_11545 [Chloroflexota bacterium]|nr:hypothetical protein [Chloroflexota bacterium]
MAEVSVRIYRDRQEDKAFRRNVASVRRVLPSWGLHDVFECYELSGRQASDVVRFLSTHRYLVSTLLDGVGHIRQVFGQPKVYLEVDRDPDENSEELFGVIMADMEPEAALASLARFDREWFAQTDNRVRSKLNFTVDTPGDGSV